MLMKRLKYKIMVCLALMLLMPASVFAMGVSPYLPLNMSPDIERQIERLLILAGRPVLTRPIAVATVLEAMHDARKADDVLCRQVERYLERYMPDSGLTQLRVELGIGSGDSEQVLPNQYGKKVDSSWEVSGEAYYRLGNYISLNLGGVAYQGDSTPTGTMLSMGIDYAQLDVGYRPHWLSPFTDSSMLLSTEAPTMPSITLSNYRPISGLGLSYQVFLAKMSKSSHIAFQDRLTTGKPRLAGLHLQIEPASGWAFSVNRLLQYGGGERNEDGFSDFLKAFWQPGKYDNTSSSLNSDQEFGNQQASLTSRIIFPGKHPFAVYFEYAGEDTSDRKNYLLGNVSFSMGVDLPRLWDQFDLTYEATDWQNGWYVHGIYKDGMTNHSMNVGHWFGDERQSNDSVGGISHMLRLGWQLRDGSYVQGVYRTLMNESYSSVSYQRMQELGLSYSHPWHGQTVGAELDSGRDVYGNGYARLSATLSFAQDWRNVSDYSVLTSSDTDDSTDLLIDLGMNYSKLDIKFGDIQVGTSDHKTANSSNLHLGLGVQRTMSEHSDLGVRIEWDRAAGHDLLSIRMMDYRYRIGKHFALNGFFGVARYDLGTPAYGYYFGGGAQVLNVLPDSDLCFDVRRHFKMERDKVLPSDFSGTHSDFYNLLGMTVYLSHRF
jgi:hypothetical protein